MKNNTTNLISNKEDKIIEYSFKLFLLDILLKRKTLSESEYNQIKKIIDNEYIKYMNDVK